MSVLTAHKAVALAEEPGYTKEAVVVAAVEVPDCNLVDYMAEEWLAGRKAASSDVCWAPRSAASDT